MSPLANTAPSPVRLVAIPRLAAGGRWRVEAMRSISEPVLLWFTKGQGRITVAGATRGYTAHNAVFIPPGTMHGFEAGPQVFGTAVFFGRDLEGRGAVLPGEPQHLRIRESLAAQEINAILDAVLREISGGLPAAERAVRHHMGLLGVWIERQVARTAAGAARPDAAHRLVARFAALMEHDFRSGLGVGDFAGALGVTPTHLSRCCRQVNGRPASALLQDRVLFEARRLLAETGLPVGRIAGTLGFTSPAYFTRAFAHGTGQSPSAFRRGH